MRIIVTAGGTGGHIYPALAIINKIKEKDKTSKILYIGTLDRMESVIVPKHNIDYIGINMQGLNRKNPFKNIKVIANFYKAKKECIKIMKEFKPDVVLGIGGYVTAPVILAAHSLGIKTFIHEQNSIPGLSNKILMRYVDKIGVSLPSSIEFFDKKKVVFTGNPRSEEVYNAKSVLKSKYNLTNDKKLVLIVMGSLGSLVINEKMKEVLKGFKNKDYEVLFVTGKAYFDEYKKINIPANVRIEPYIEDMPSLMKKCDLIVSRAGATAISEITVLGIPSILIPSPHVTHNHQYKNAKVLSDRGASVIIEEKDLTSDNLIKNIDEIILNKEKYDIMSTESKKLGVENSASKIYEVIKKLKDGV